MAKNWPHSQIVNGRLVGFSVKKLYNDPCFYVCFRSPNGRRLKKDTNQPRMAGAIEAAKIIIERKYAPSPDTPDKVTWDDAVERLTRRFKTSGIRETTAGYYFKLIRLVRKMYDVGDCAPDDITPGMAEAFRDTTMTTPGRRKKLPSAHYVTGLLVGLSALWQKWFLEELKIVAGNPWEDVTPPKADRLPVKYATDDLVEPFYRWIAERFGDWPFPKLFLSAKSSTGCRLMDLCSLKSAQLQGGRLVFPPDVTKGRKEWKVPLPDDLFRSLDAFKGKTWLWENYLPGLRTALAAEDWPTHQLNMTFDPRRLYYWVETLFSDYRKVHPDRALTSYMFRKRAFTMAWEKGIDVRHASIAYGCNVDTVMQHYVALDEQQVTDDVFERMHGENRNLNGT